MSIRPLQMHSDEELCKAIGEAYEKIEGGLNNAQIIGSGRGDVPPGDNIMRFLTLLSELERRGFEVGEQTTLIVRRKS